MRHKKLIVFCLVSSLVATSVIGVVIWNDPLEDFFDAMEYDPNDIVATATGSMYENQYGKLEIYPDISQGIVHQEQYANLTSYIDDTEIDVTFRFDMEIGNPDIWMWRNISHWVSVPTYGWVTSNYTLVNIENIEVISEPEYVDLGDIPSDYYRNGTGCYWDDMEAVWLNGSLVIGFDSFEWLNPEHTSARFTYTYWGVTGNTGEEQYWFDWDNIKDKFNHVEHNGKHYYYIRDVMIKDKLYQFKWEYDIPLGSDGKWDLLAKKSSDPLGTWRVAIDPWWDSDWDYYKTVYIANKIDNYQMKLIIDWDADVGGDVSLEGNGQADFDDVRFVYDNSTELPYWIESYTASTQATFWVNNSGNYDKFEMYYGNAGVSDNSDGVATFIFFDDFEETIGQSPSKWTVYSGSTLNADISDDVAFQGTRSAKQGHEGSSTVYSITGGFYNPDDVRFLFWHYSTDDAARDTTYYGVDERISDDSMPAAGRTTFQAANDIEVYEGSWVDSNRDYYETVWERIEMRNNDGADDFYLISNEGASTNNDHDYQNNMVAINNFVSTTSSSYPTSYLDCICVMLYTNGVEPSWSSFGSEESAPPPPVNNDPVNSEAIPNLIGGVAINIDLQITVNDADGDTMNQTFWTNASGTWLAIAWNNNTGNDTLVNSTVDTFDSEYTEYWWNSSVEDGNGGWDNDTYSFTTGAPSWDYGQEIAWLVRNVTGVTILKLAVNGNLAIAGELWNNTNSPPPGANIVLNMNNSFWLDMNGTLYIKDEFYEES